MFAVLSALRDRVIRILAVAHATVMTPVMNAKNDRTILSWILISILCLMALQLLEVVLDLWQLFS